MRRTALAVTAATLSLAVLTGCASDQAEPSVSPEVSGTTAVSDPASVEPTQTGFHTEYTFPPQPSWDEDAEVAALSVAEEAMTAYFQRDQDDWWQHVGPYFTADAAQLYVNTDPRRIPDTRITGSANLIDSPSPYLAWVDVPTTVGDWTVLLGCESEGAPWLIHEIQPPEGIH